MADMDFQFLRLEKPDVMRYLPKFLAEDEHTTAGNHRHSKSVLC
jgi:hypothetical protein